MSEPAAKSDTAEKPVDPNACDRDPDGGQKPEPEHEPHSFFASSEATPPDETTPPEAP